MDLTSFLLVVGLGALLFYLLFGPGTKKGKNLPPGPTGGLPIIGQLLKIDRTQPFSESVAKWADEYGPIFGIRLGSYYTVFLNDPKLIRDTLNDPALNGRPDNRIWKTVSGGNHGILFADGGTWVEQRRFTLRHLREFGFGKNVMETLILDEARDLLDAFRPDVGRSITGLGRRFSLAVLSSLWFIVSGERLNHDDAELKDILEDVFRQMDSVFARGMLSFVPALATLGPEQSGYNDLVRAIDRSTTFMKPYITEHEKSRIEGQPRDFIDSYLEEMQKAKDPGTSFYKEQGYKNLLAVIMDLFGAGAETTSTTLDWAVLYLATNQHIQKELQGEIDAVLGYGVAARLPSLADKARMPYTEAVMMEVMRYASIAGLGLFHTSLTDVKIGGYDIPRGTFVVPSLRYVHHDPRLWDEPARFNPTRFLRTGDDGSVTCARSENLMPFAVGKRVCLGETLARDEFFLFLVCIFQRYAIELDPTKPPASGSPLHTFILKPRPYHVIIRERGSNSN